MAGDMHALLQKDIQSGIARKIFEIITTDALTDLMHFRFKTILGNKLNVFACI